MRALRRETELPTLLSLPYCLDAFVFNLIFATAKEFKCDTVVGEYIISHKNKLVQNLYKDFQFVALPNNDNRELWQQKVSDYEIRKHYINL